MNTITNLKVRGKEMRRPESLQKKIPKHLPTAFFFYGMCSSKCNSCMSQMNLLFVEQVVMLLGFRDAEGTHD